MKRKKKKTNQRPVTSQRQVKSQRQVLNLKQVKNPRQELNLREEFQRQTKGRKNQRLNLVKKKMREVLENRAARNQ